MTLGTPEGLEPATSDHIVEHVCLSCGEPGAHWVSSHVDDAGTLVEGWFLCEVAE